MNSQFMRALAHQPLYSVDPDYESLIRFWVLKILVELGATTEIYR